MYDNFVEIINCILILQILKLEFYGDKKTYLVLIFMNILVLLIAILIDIYNF